ncbi:MAG: hypothetical protein ACI4JT_04545 [Oscillospiraceae bacterium]
MFAGLLRLVFGIKDKQ